MKINSVGHTIFLVRVECGSKTPSFLVNLHEDFQPTHWILVMEHKSHKIKSSHTLIF